MLNNVIDISHHNTVASFQEVKNNGNAGDQPHQVPGIGRCDRNKFNGSMEGLQKICGVSPRL